MEKQVQTVWLVEKKTGAAMRLTVGAFVPEIVKALNAADMTKVEVWVDGPVGIDKLYHSLFARSDTASPWVWICGGLAVEVGHSSNQGVPLAERERQIVRDRWLENMEGI